MKSEIERSGKIKSITNNLNEEEIFTILAHPLRRKILKTIYDNGKVTYTTLTQEWKLKTGTVYFHLKELNALVEQNENKEYILNDDGKVICKWFLGSKEGQITVVKIDAFSQFSNFIIRVSNFSYITPLLLLVAIGAFIFSNNLKVMSVGNFILPVPAFIDFENVVYINFIWFFALIFLYNLIGKLLAYEKFKISIETFRIFLLSHVFSYVGIIALVLINFYYPFSLSLIAWIVLSTILQLIYVVLTSSFHIVIYGIDINTSLLISVIILYINLVFAIFLV